MRCVKSSTPGDGTFSGYECLSKCIFLMVNRRGLPKEIYSDNGTNFVGANQELKDVVTNLDEETLKESLANRGVKWFFNR